MYLPTPPSWLEVQYVNFLKLLKMARTQDTIKIGVSPAYMGQLDKVCECV